jgi:hypothetical protein
MLPEVRAWERARPPESPRLLLVSTGDLETNRAMNLGSRVVLDQAFRTGSAFGATGTPSAVRINHAGRISAPLAVGAPAVLAILSPTLQHSEERSAHAVRA